MKDNAKEQVLAAIQTLRAKGAEINPYTVANEGGVPRSTIYRNAELMELISREKAEPAEKLVAKDSGFPDRIAELEAQVEELGQTIWNLEKQNEDLQKDFSDAWTMGFAAGLEEANKRHAKGIKSDAPTPVTESSAWPSVERNAATTDALPDSNTVTSSPIITPAPSGDEFSATLGEIDVQAHPAPVITPISVPAASTTDTQPGEVIKAATTASESNDAVTADPAVAATASTVNASASKATAPVTAANAHGQPAAASVDASSAIAAAAVAASSASISSMRSTIDQAESGTFNAAAAPIKSSQNLTSMIDFSTAAENEAAPGSAGKSAASKGASTKDRSQTGGEKIIIADPVGEEDQFAYYGDEVVLGQEYLYSEELLKEAESILFGGDEAKDARDAKGKDSEPKDDVAESRPGWVERGAAKEVVASNYTLDFSQAPSQPPSPATPGSAGLESGLNIGTVAAVTAPPAPPAPQAKPAADIFAAQHAYDPASGIYNVARSGPYVASEFNPLIELSWKDIEDVYNYRASTLKDYARNVPSAPNKLGAVISTENGGNGANGDRKPGEFSDSAGIVDASILAMMPSDSELESTQQLDTAVYMSEEVTDVVPEGTPTATNNQDPDATGDRMQAMVGYRADAYANRLNPAEEEKSAPTQPKQPTQAFDSEGIVDLDALDIFENLNEWIDIDKLERGEDPFGRGPAQPATGAAQNVKKDELAELIKKRIEQASEMAPDAAQSRGLGFGKPPSHAGPQPATEAAEPTGEPSQPRARNKFIGGKASSETPAPAPTTPFVKAIPADIRKACLILGVRSEEMTTAMVVEAWKKQIVDVHPDKGGDTETAIILNTAKDTLVHWIEAQAPKLGKKFGGMGKESPQKDKDKDKG